MCVIVGVYRDVHTKRQPPQSYSHWSNESFVLVPAQHTLSKRSRSRSQSTVREGGRTDAHRYWAPRHRHIQETVRNPCALQLVSFQPVARIVTDTGSWRPRLQSARESGHGDDPTGPDIRTSMRTSGGMSGLWGPLVQLICRS